MNDSFKITYVLKCLGCEDNRENWNALAESRPPPGTNQSKARPTENNQSQPRIPIVTNQSESKTTTINNQSADNQSECRSESGNQSESSDKVQQSHKSAPPGESNAG